MRAETYQLTQSSIGRINNSLNRVLDFNVANKKQKIEVVVRNVKTNAQLREIAQNSLNWHWCGEEANFHNARATHLGKEYKPQDIHEQNKLDYGVPILCRDMDFMMVWQPFRYFTREAKLRVLKKLPVTSIMDIKQMTEYLTTIKIDKESKGIVLTDKDDMFNQAMGRKR